MFHLFKSETFTPNFLAIFPRNSPYLILYIIFESIEYKSGTQGSTEAIYKLFLFDVRMLTRLTLSTGNVTAISPSLFANHTNGGVQVKGATSGATGYVYKGLHPFTTNTYSAWTYC